MDLNRFFFSLQCYCLGLPKKTFMSSRTTTTNGEHISKGINRRLSSTETIICAIIIHGIYCHHTVHSAQYTRPNLPLTTASFHTHSHNINQITLWIEDYGLTRELWFIVNHFENRKSMLWPLPFLCVYRNKNELYFAQTVIHGVRVFWWCGAHNVRYFDCLLGETKINSFGLKNLFTINAFKRSRQSMSSK